MASDNSLKKRFRSDIEGHLKGDIDSDALLLDYLPEVDLWTGAIVATEALVRWRHPDRGVLLPDSFIGVAESMNLAAIWTGGCFGPRARSSVDGVRVAWDETRHCG